MPKKKRFALKTQSIPAQIQANTSIMSESASHGSPHSAPPSHTIPNQNPMQDESQNQQPTSPEVQHTQSTPTENQPTHPEDQRRPPTYKRKSEKHWTVDVIDEDGVRKETRLRVCDWFALPSGKKVVLEWNENGQPIGEAAGLLGGALGSIAANFDDFPISYNRWPKVPSTYKESVWKNPIKAKFDVNDGVHKKYVIENIGKKWKDNRVRLFAEFYDETLSWEANLESRPDGMPREQWDAFLSYRLSEKTMGICEKNAANRQKQTIPHTLGSKTIARKKHELEIQTGRPYSRGEMYSITHTRKDGTFVNDEAKQKSEQLDELMDHTSSENDAYVDVFGKEHSGRVRGMGFGITPTQAFGPTYHYGSSSSSSSAGPSSSEFEKMKLELQASNEKVEALQQEVSKFRTVEQQVAYLMQTFGGQFPPNQASDLGSPAEVRRSSNGSHDLSNHGDGSPSA